MDGNGEKKTIWKHFLRWGLLVLGLALGSGGAWSFYLESNRNYGQLATSLITISGVVLTLWMAHERAIEQQEKEDERHNARLESESTRHDERLRAEAEMQDERLRTESEREHKRLTAEDDRYHARLEAEAKMHDERLRVESEREHKRLIAEAQKDRAQRSITQRIDLAEKLAAAIEHLYDEKELKQAAGVQEILFQIDDWHALIESEIARIEEGRDDVEFRKKELKKESLRHRQELFDIAYKFDAKTEKVELLKSRARGLKQRLVEDGAHSLAGLDFSGMVIGMSSTEENNDFRIDLERIFAKGFTMTFSEMSNVELSYAHLEGAYLQVACLEGAHLQAAHLEGAHLQIARLGGAHLQAAHLEGAYLPFAHLEGADLEEAHLEGAVLDEAHLEGAHLKGTHLEGADLREANLEGVYFDYDALRDKKLLDGALYDEKTIFPKGFNPEEYGMILVDEEDMES